MLEALLVMAGIALVLGAGLGYAAIRFKVQGDPLVDKIDAILPQTQCGQCGFPGCRPYANAIADGEADINQCPPGGDEGVRKLADLLGREYKPLNEEHGVEKPKAVAMIDEQTCIGCTLCIQACPVDAIVGAAKQMHTVVEADCMVALLLRIKKDHAILLVEHDMDAVFALADALTVMVNGQVIASGAPDAIRGDANVQAAYLGEEH